MILFLRNVLSTLIVCYFCKENQKFFKFRYIETIRTAFFLKKASIFLEGMCNKKKKQNWRAENISLVASCLVMQALKWNYRNLLLEGELPSFTGHEAGQYFIVNSQPEEMNSFISGKRLYSIRPIRFRSSIFLIASRTFGVIFPYQIFITFEAQK